MAIKAILLNPTEGDPHGLLKEGPCGAPPPMAISGHLCGYAPSAVPGAIECALDGDQMIRSIAKLGTIVLLDADGKEITDAS